MESSTLNQFYIWDNSGCTAQEINCFQMFYIKITKIDLYILKFSLYYR